MDPRHRRYTRIGFVAFALLTLTVWQVPAFLSAERYRRRLEAGLEHLLQRPVTFSSGSLRLLPRPGFSLENVVVREDPAFGSEPFARIDRMECDLRWHSLWRSRLEFVRLRLERPSLNLVRDAQGEWNVENLLLRTGIVSADSPDVTMRLVDWGKGVQSKIKGKPMSETVVAARRQARY
jgi:AsmA protein